MITLQISLLLSVTIRYSNSSGFLKMWPVNKDGFPKYQTGYFFYILQDKNNCLVQQKKIHPYICILGYINLLKKIKWLQVVFT